ncbi:MAG: prepilin-type N-terminal cleavage/methylation domain-containing protein, partial [Nitrospinae bacterium]|nr:prepilin-type N-terminal cleavage/methylation domain-containing protein [Nitrospinota bacterium]
MERYASSRSRKAGRLSAPKKTTYETASNKEQGFTLLELLISIAIIAMIVAIALGGMKFGITAREIGEQRTETFQRLRFIGEQISTQIKSLHPLFIEPVEIAQPEPDKPATAEVPKVLAFEGTENSLRFITFAETLAHN